MDKICQKFKNRKTLYGNLTPNNIVHVDLIGTYSKSIRQHQPGVTVICKNASLTCMKIIDPATCWFQIVNMPMFELEEVALGNY